MDEDWPYSDQDMYAPVHTEDLFTEDEKKAMEEDAREQILVTAGRIFVQRPCKCESPTTGRKPWTCFKCGGRYSGYKAKM